ncbi:MAG TPA: hypothetical protein VGN77_06525 [Steroidobacteraceae bacterium]|nr:hypothetical protein [Steroidobacteraceae bacterium]
MEELDAEGVDGGVDGLLAHPTISHAATIPNGILPGENSRDRDARPIR